MIETRKTYLLCCKSNKTKVLPPIESPVLGKVAIYNLQCRLKSIDAIDLISECCAFATSKSRNQSPCIDCIRSAWRNKDEHMMLHIAPKVTSNSQATISL